MKKTENRSRVIALLFAHNPHDKSFFMTSDDQAFRQEGDARNHAKTLEDKEIETVKNPGKSAPAESTELSDEDKAALAEKAALAQAAKEEKAAKDAAALAAKAEKDALVVRYTELFGKAPAKNIGLDVLKSKIAEKEAEANKPKEGEA